MYKIEITTLEDKFYLELELSVSIDLEEVRNKINKFWDDCLKDVTCGEYKTSVDSDVITEKPFYSPKMITPSKLYNSYLSTLKNSGTVLYCPECGSKLINLSEMLVCSNMRCNFRIG